jgi:hypothetical protein
MVRVLRAFAWMRWRVLVNSLDRTGARDTLERLSLAVEQIGPILAAALFVPSALSLAALSGYAGYAWSAADGQPSIIVEILRYLLLAAVALSIVGPIMLPSSERTNVVRFLLLPIRRQVLYVAQTASALTDPWILLTVPVLAALPIGLAAGGAPGAAAVALVAGAVLLAVLLGLSSVATVLLHLMLRDRRRGELIALLFIVVLPVAVMLPGLLSDDDRPRAPGRSRRDAPLPGWVMSTGRAAWTIAPSELYHASVREAASRRIPSALPPLLALAGLGGALHGLGVAAFGRMLDSPASTGPRRGATAGRRRAAAVPGLSPGASAVAVNQLRLAFRTPRGRSILLSPLLVFVLFLLLMRRGGDMELGFVTLEGGLGLATFGAAVCLLSILPFAMNQFAIDKAGLTLQFLTPLSDLDMLIGKAVGNGLIAGLPGLACVALAFLVFGGGSAALWMGLPFGLVSTYLLAAPAAAVFSAIFPRAVDLNSIGSGSNAHGLAGLLGIATFAAAALPPVLITLAATAVLERRAAVPLLLAGWCLIALVLFRLLLSPVARVVGQRRENLAMVA